MTFSRSIFSSLRDFVGRCWACAAALMALMVLSTALHAATFTVNDLGDAPDAIPVDGICAAVGNVCTLRAAIQTANLLGGAHVINVPVGTIVLASSLSLIANITINGAGTSSTVVSGNGVAQVFVFSLNGINVAMNDLTIANGVASAGAGVFVTTSSTLSLLRVLVTNINATLGIQQGGGRHVSGILNLTDSTVSNNSAANAGGGIRVLSGATATIVNSTITGNSVTAIGAGGAGIESLGTLVLVNTTVSGNTIGAGGDSGIAVDRGLS